MDGNKNLNLHLMITCDSDDARSAEHKPEGGIRSRR
jgi:hypothetical protein